MKLAFCLSVTSIFLFAVPLVAQTGNPDIDKWAPNIAALEKLDREEKDPEDAVLLLGSSSIRLWDDAATALKPYAVIRRGYGGAKYSDLAAYATRLITPHRYRAIVIFVGNDVSGKKKDAKPDQVESWVRKILQVSRQHQPEAKIFFVEITPAPVRFAVWPEIRRVNAMLRELTLTEPNVFFVTTAEHYLTDDDQPREDLFRDDRLHQNEKGYRIWASLIRDSLDDVFNNGVSTHK